MRPAIEMEAEACLTNLLLSFPSGGEVHGTLEELLSENVWTHRYVKYTKWTVAVTWISLQKKNVHLGARNTVS